MPLITEGLELSDNARRVLERRYLARDSEGDIIETPEEMFRRVARNIAQAERNYGASDALVREIEERFNEMMTSLEFLPNSPTLMNAGRDLQQLSACFVLPIDDDMESIFDALKYAAIVHKSGGGTGFSFSRLRPKNDVVKSSGGIASGPVSFMKIFNSATEQIKQGGTRRGANMGILRVDHPDILEFITCKDDHKEITNFNISVAVTDRFMRDWTEGRRYPLVNPRTGETVEEVDAREVMDRIAYQAWKNGEPGIFFIDTANRGNPTPDLGEIESTNPCGEQPLLPYESCNLGSINLERHLRRNGKGWEIDWNHLERTVRDAVRFLDDVIDMNEFPIPRIREVTRSTRKIGLGVMGFARMLFKLGIPYGSQEGVETAEKVMKFINDIGHDESSRLASTRGVFPAWERSIYAERGIRMRNAYVTTIAPTGTLCMIAETSGGCEPEFSLIWYKNVMDGENLPYVLDYFVEVAKNEGFWSEDLLEKIAANHGSVRGLKDVPPEWQKVFEVAHDIAPEWHVRMQSAFQKYTDSAVSKTINMVNDATVDDVKQAYVLAYGLGCKGITVYRDGCRANQVMNVGTPEKSAREILPTSAAGPIVLTPRPRPDVVAGTTQKVNTPYGTLYVTINEDANGLFEVFALIGRSGGYTASFTEALARMISLCLRSGVPEEEVIRQLEGIRSPKITYDHGERIFSVPDALAKALKRQVAGDLYKGIQVRMDHFSKNPNGLNEREVDEVGVHDSEEEYEDAEIEVVRRGMSPECPQCGMNIVFEEGCMRCRSCGYSEC